MNGAEERAIHPEGPGFRKFFTRLLMVHTGSCWERDILRDNQEVLWQAWKAKASGYPCPLCGGKGFGHFTVGELNMQSCPECDGKGHK